MLSKIIIPMAIQLRIDDIGWQNSADESSIGRPSRTAMPRRHHWKDYIFLNKLGEALNQKISCSLVLGEWDKDNFLKGQKGFCWDPDNWDMSSWIDMEYNSKAFEILESGEYIDYTFHGVLHGVYANDGRQITERELYTMKYDSETDTYLDETTWKSKEEIKRTLDMFFRIYNSWGFKKSVKSIACGNANYGAPNSEGNRMYAKFFSEYGIDVWQDVWYDMSPKTADVTEGVTCLKLNLDKMIPWNECDYNPDKMLPYHDLGDKNFYGDFCTHWVNYLHYDPDQNCRHLSKWVEYYKKQGETFGYMLSRDVCFAASQAVYSQYSTLSFEDNKCIIDFTKADNKKARVLKDEFYISIKNEMHPSECDGGTMSVYETKNDFVTYKILRNKKDNITMLFENS